MFVALAVAGALLVATRPGTVDDDTRPGTVDDDTKTPAAMLDQRGGGARSGDAARGDGDVRGDVTVFDDDVPAVAGLDPDLLEALRSAATDAAADGIVFYVNSGWRSPAYQEQLLREAVAEYGSVEEASRWVATAETSSHVRGDAIDVGHSDVTMWLSERGAEYGLCQIYANEPWHYELRPGARVDGCPAVYVDASRDPRLHE
ncbi:M15 family metallopeptidase [Rhodococcus artemisiae]|uniref:M15 family metallopeptidase n=1 Tax=Rhodococcus artemisiae TaxID=714159 RepID=A0ABU7L308_9NOCA|nr:M15 family metallopeptidase [Rhodococcus artemisiae]MEE2055936.1 M15 family metallopeptidase [Rhodococcus artemisiae]